MKYMKHLDTKNSNIYSTTDLIELLGSYYRKDVNYAN